MLETLALIVLALLAGLLSAAGEQFFRAYRRRGTDGRGAAVVISFGCYHVLRGAD